MVPELQNLRHAYTSDQEMADRSKHAFRFLHGM